MKLLQIKKNLTGYIAAIVLLVAAAAYSFYILNELNSAYGKFNNSRESLEIIANIDAGLQNLELCQCKNRESFTIQLCDTLYVGLEEKGIKLKELVKINPRQAEKCNLFLSTIEEERKTQINTDSSISDRLNKREIKEFIERGKILRLKKYTAEIRTTEANILEETKLLIDGKIKSFIYSLIYAALLILSTIVYSLIIISKEIKDKNRFQKSRDAYINIAKAAEEAKSADKLYKKIHEIIIELTGTENFYAAVYNAKEDTVAFPYFVNNTDQKPENRTAGRGIAEFIIRTNLPLLAAYDDITKLIDEGEISNDGSGVISLIASPIGYGSSVFGAIVVQSYQADKLLTEKDLAVLNFAAKVLAELLLKLNMEEQNSITSETIELEKSVIEGNLAEIKVLSSKLRDAEYQIEMLRANKDKYFAILSHDLKSPFNSLIGFSDILVEDFDDLSKEEIKKYADIISASTHNLYNLIDNIVQWSKIQRNTLDFAPAIINLKSEVIYIFDLLGPNAAKKNITLVNKADAGIKIMADKNMLHSTLQNMVLNAIKFTPKDGRVVVEATDKKQFTEVIIADTGVGIKKENIEKLFQIEKSFSTKGTENEQGTGLGLILVKAMVEKHGGKIKVSSVEGKGTAFFIEYPKVT